MRSAGRTPCLAAWWRFPLIGDGRLWRPIPHRARCPGRSGRATIRERKGHDECADAHHPTKSRRPGRVPLRRRGRGGPRLALGRREDGVDARRRGGRRRQQQQDGLRKSRVLRVHVGKPLGAPEMFGEAAGTATHEIDRAPPPGRRIGHCILTETKLTRAAVACKPASRREAVQGNADRQTPPER